MTNFYFLLKYLANSLNAQRYEWVPRKQTEATKYKTGSYQEKDKTYKHMKSLEEEWKENDSAGL